MCYFLKNYLTIFTVNTWSNMERVTFSLSIKLYFGISAVFAFWSQWHWKDNFLNNPLIYKNIQSLLSVNKSRASRTNTCKNPNHMSKMQPFLFKYAKTVIVIPTDLTQHRINSFPLQKEMNVVAWYHFSVSRFFCCSFVSRCFAQEHLLLLGRTLSGIILQ